MVALLSLRFGALVKPLVEQIREQGIACSSEDGEKWQRWHDEIVSLRLHRILTDSEAHRANQRLIKKIHSAIAGTRTRAL